MTQNITFTWHSSNHRPTPLAHFLPDMRESNGSPLVQLGGPNPWTSGPATPLTIPQPLPDYSERFTTTVVSIFV